MTVLMQILLATALIAAMIVVRVFANRAALRRRLHCSHAGTNCNDTACDRHANQNRSDQHAS
jgi:hypothetical protein